MLMCSSFSGIQLEQTEAQSRPAPSDRQSFQPFSVAVARAGATNNHVVDGEIIFLSDVDGIRILKVLISLKLFISERVEAGEGDSQVCGFQQVLNLLAVRVKARRVELDVGREDPVDDLPLGGGSQGRVALLTDNLTQRLRHS